MGNDGNAYVLHPIFIDQYRSPLPCHHHDLACPLQQRGHDPPLSQTGVFRNGMERQDQRQSCAIQEVEDHVPGRSTEYAELMLEPDGLRSAILDPSCRFGIGSAIIARDGINRIGIQDAVGPIVHCIAVYPHDGKSGT